ncbi:MULTISPECIES: DNA polymerase III subunit gamma/tau [Prevotella]|nr:MULTISPECIES: DNA polymerase III subunit gamma/tau [Prevotella]MDN5553292.1 DNA polymerase III subunit gamma/tau [Prevotella sp.]
MEEYIVSARKYRPMTFDSVVGQSALTTTLKNAVKGGRLAHAYLFCGPRGVGKTTCARIFAKAINCEHPREDGEACNECESCKSFNEQRSYNIFELDAASNNSVENIKALMEQTRIPPQIGRYKVFIIDEVHMLSTAAFNAFLKTLEEPPAHVIFILATTEKHKILPTILSRCQIYDFERMTVSNTINHLKSVADKEGIKYEEEALSVIAEKADGGMRDALSIFDQAASFCMGNITYQKVIEDLNVLDSENYFKVVDYSLTNKVSDIMLLLNNILGKGFDGGNLINGLASHVRNVLMAKDQQTLSLLETSEQQRQKFYEQAQKCPVDFLYKTLKILNQCDINYKQSSNKRLLVEISLIQVAQITQPDDDSASARRSPKRLKSLFKNLILSQQKAASQVAAAKSHALSPRDRNKEVTQEPQEENVSIVTASVPDNSSDSLQRVSGAARHKVKLNNIGFTFKSARTKKEGQTVDSDEKYRTNKEEVGHFSQEDLERCWLGMCTRMPQTLKGIASRMKNITPIISDYPVIEAVIDNQILLNQIDEIKPRIRKTLAGDLHNGNIKIKLRLAEAAEVKQIMSKRDVFESLKKDNDSFSKLCKNLELDLT